MVGVVEEIRSFLIRFYAKTGIHIGEIVLREKAWMVVYGDVLRRCRFKIGEDPEPREDDLRIASSHGMCKITLHPEDKENILRRINAIANEKI